MGGVRRLRLGQVALWQGDLELARTQLEASLAAARQVVEKQLVGWALTGLAQVVQRQGDLERASALLEESLALYTALGDRREMGLVLQALGQVAWLRGDQSQARLLWGQSLRLRQEAKDRLGVAECLEALATAAAQCRPEQAARLLGAAAAVRDAMGTPLPPVERPSNEATMQTAKAALGQEAFAATWVAGQALSLEQVVAEALADETGGSDESAGAT